MEQNEILMSAYNRTEEESLKAGMLKAFFNWIYLYDISLFKMTPEHILLERRKCLAMTIRHRGAW